MSTRWSEHWVSSATPKLRFANIARTSITDPRKKTAHSRAFRRHTLTLRGTFDNIRLKPAGTGAFRGGDANGAAEADFDQSFEAINAGSQAGAGSAYIVSDGDTLQSIAMAVWGDAQLWHLIAEANGLSLASPLVGGQSILIPNKVANSHNSAATFKPYDPNEALGDNTPGAIKPNAGAGKKGNKCGVVGQILLVAVAVAVSIATSGALSGAMPSVLAGVLGGAAGSIASQGVGLATGIQDKFDFKGVGLAAISGGVGAGLGSVGALAKVAGSSVLGGAVRGALGSALTQGAAVVTGLQGRFDWAGVAVGAIGGGVGSALGGGIFGRVQGGSLGYYGTQTFRGAAAAIAGAGARSLLTGTSFGDNILAVLPEVIGSTIGNAVVDGVAMRSVVRGDKSGLPSRQGAEVKSASYFADPTEAYDPRVPDNDLVIGPPRMSWLEKRAYDLTGLFERGFNWAIDHNPMTLTMQAGGAASRYVGATNVARQFDNGASFSTGYWRGVAYAPVDAVRSVVNTVRHPVNTLLGLAGTLDNVIATNPSDIRDGFSRLQRDLATGGPAAYEHIGVTTGGIVGNTALSVAAPALRGGSVARFGATAERLAPVATPVSPAVSAFAAGTTPELLQVGGAYRNVRGISGFEAHHMPADSISPLFTGEGPSIAMATDDHRLTASWGNSRAARAYRQTQADLIAQGDFRSAQQLDINDINAKFGTKYDDAIQQMLRYSLSKGW